MSVSTHEAEARRRLRSATGRIAVCSRYDRQDHSEGLLTAREDHAAAIVEFAIIRALNEAPELSAERRARLAELLTAGDPK